jgi:hypothetical protein
VRNGGFASAATRIDQITDSKTGAVNYVITLGSPFTVEGVMMKITGTSVPGDRIGVSFASPGSPGVDITELAPRMSGLMINPMMILQKLIRLASLLKQGKNCSGMPLMNRNIESPLLLSDVV